MFVKKQEKKCEEKMGKIRKIPKWSNLVSNHPIRLEYEIIVKMKSLRADEFWSLFILVILILLIGIKPNLILDISHESSYNIINSLVTKL